MRNDRIKKIAVIRETDKTVTLQGGGRFAKVSDTMSFHDTFDEAKAFLIAEHEAKVARLRIQLEQAKGKLGQIRGMRELEEGRG
ncbi:MAG: hypothetical protein MZU84_03310 [Sphingobacterium sp.]|nr:hypothetical protein [Sphingobacterium sp.]